MNKFIFHWSLLKFCQSVMSFLLSSCWWVYYWVKRHFIPLLWEASLFLLALQTLFVNILLIFPSSSSFSTFFSFTILYHPVRELWAKNIMLQSDFFTSMRLFFFCKNKKNKNVIEYFPLPLYRFCKSRDKNLIIIIINTQILIYKSTEEKILEYSDNKTQLHENLSFD